MRHIEQSDDSAKKVQPMCRGENVKETAAGIGDQKNALTGKLAPGHELTNQKKHAQARGYVPPALESDLFATVQITSRRLNGDAARQQNQSIQPKHTRKIERDPVVPQPLAHQQRAGQCHEKHDDAGEPQLNDRKVSALRYTVEAAPGAFSIIIAAGGNVCPAAATRVNYLNFVSDRARHNRTPLVRLSHSLWRQVLWNVVLGRSRYAEFIRAAIDHGDMPREVVKRGR